MEPERDTCSCMGDPDGPAPVCGKLCNGVQCWSAIVCLLVVVCVMTIGMYSCSQSETCDLAKYLVWVWAAGVAALMFMVCVLACSGTFMRRACKRICCCACVESAYSSSSRVPFEMQQQHQHQRQQLHEEPTELVISRGPNGRPIVDVHTLGPVMVATPTDAASPPPEESSSRTSTSSTRPFTLE